MAGAPALRGSGPRKKQWTRSGRRPGHRVASQCARPPWDAVHREPAESAGVQWRRAQSARSLWDDARLREPPLRGVPCGLARDAVARRPVRGVPCRLGRAPSVGPVPLRGLRSGRLLLRERPRVGRTALGGTATGSAAGAGVAVGRSQACAKRAGGRPRSCDLRLSTLSLDR